MALILRVKDNLKIKVVLAHGRPGPFSRPGLSRDGQTTRTTSHPDHKPSLNW
jgi:hypothetical protein